MNEKALPLIEKLINLTKTNELFWVPYKSTSTLLMPLKTNPFNPIYFDEDNIFFDSSFACEHCDISFFLMAWYRTPESYLSLMAQTNHSVFSKLYATTFGSNEEESSELKRLYNLIDSSVDPIDIKIKQFIDL